MVITILVSLVTQPRREEDLVGLVYSLTKRTSEGHLPWYQRPEALGIAVLVLALILNVIFW
jgi:SSS family solute:Na+ symporter